MTDAPIRELTPRQMQVAVCVARGWDYARIAVELTMAERTVAVHVYQIAQLLPYMPGVKPQRRVMLWMLAERVTDADKESSAA